MTVVEWRLGLINVAFRRTCVATRDIITVNAKRTVTERTGFVGIYQLFAKKNQAH